MKCQYINDYSLNQMWKYTLLFSKKVKSTMNNYGKAPLNLLSFITAHSLHIEEKMCDLS